MNCASENQILSKIYLAYGMYQKYVQAIFWSGMMNYQEPTYRMSLNSNVSILKSLSNNEL